MRAHYRGKPVGDGVRRRLLRRLGRGASVPSAAGVSALAGAAVLASAGGRPTLVDSGTGVTETGGSGWCRRGGGDGHDVSCEKLAGPWERLGRTLNLNQPRIFFMLNIVLA